jgi:glutamate dehydrogenase
LALSLAQFRGVTTVERQISYMRRLERLHRLDRSVEYLPDDDALKSRAESGKGLTRPELAVLMAYAKLHLFDEIIASRLPDEPTVEAELTGYFPKALSTRFQSQIRAHGLRREIIATVLANEIVNKGGPTFVAGIADEVGADFADVAAAYRVADDVFEVSRLWNAIDGLDNAIPATMQIRLYLSLRDTLRRETLWFLREAPRPIDLGEAIGRYRPGVQELKQSTPIAANSEWLAAGVPEALAKEISALGQIQSAGDIIDIAGTVGREIGDAGAVHRELGRVLGIDRLFRAADAINPPDQWTRLALRAVTDDLAGHHRKLAAAVLQQGGKDPIEAVRAWVAERAPRIEPLNQLIADVEQSGAGVAQLAVANRHLRELTPR